MLFKVTFTIIEQHLIIFRNVYIVKKFVDESSNLLYINFNNIRLLYNSIKGEMNMEMYQKAYEYYKAACENNGVESLSIYQFVKYLTKEQLNEYNKYATL